MRKTVIMAGLVALAVSASLLSFGAAPAAKVAAPAGPVIGGAAPAFSGVDSNGKTVSLADLKGKVVVLEWINVDCPIDGRVLDSKLVSNVYDKFKDKVTWLAIDSTAAHSKADYDKTLAKWNIKYPLLNDAKGIIGHAYKAQTTPHMFIINTDGKLVYMGGIDNDKDGSKSTKLNYVDKALTELLAGKAVTIAESEPYGCSVKYAE